MPLEVTVEIKGRARILIGLSKSNTFAAKFLKKLSVVELKKLSPFHTRLLLLILILVYHCGLPWWLRW